MALWTGGPGGSTGPRWTGPFGSSGSIWSARWGSDGCGVENRPDHSGRLIYPGSLDLDRTAEGRGRRWVVGGELRAAAVRRSRAGKRQRARKLIATGKTERESDGSAHRGSSWGRRYFGEGVGDEQRQERSDATGKMLPRWRRAIEGWESLLGTLRTRWRRNGARRRSDDGRQQS